MNVSWYDARVGQKHRSAEYRIYYPGEAAPIVQSSRPDDLLIIAKHRDRHLLILIVDADSTHEKQLAWLFGLSVAITTPRTIDLDYESKKELGFAARIILDELGIDVETSDENWLERIISEFGESFPSTSLFSGFARKTLPEVSSKDDPDKALMRWIEHEEMLFRTLERHFVSKRLEKKFTDVDEFISYSLGVHNRRKSRVGHALEHHLAYIFQEHNIKYSRGPETENKVKPDFIFPGISSYRDDEFRSSCLTMLGVKTTCKDRWRQVLSEAKRISKKHLFTLQPGISENQTNEMKANMLSLVLPSDLHQFFVPTQKEVLLKLGDFVELVKEKQNKCL